MINPTDSEMIAVLAKRAGWTRITSDWWWQTPHRGPRYHLHPDELESDMALVSVVRLQQKLCEDAEFSIAFRIAVMDEAERHNIWAVGFALSLSPADRTRLLYAAHIAGEERG